MWYKGKKHGTGKLIKLDGTYKEGTWENGKKLKKDFKV